jgi:hypothetical protein
MTNEPRIEQAAAMLALRKRLERDLWLVRTSLAYSKGSAATLRRAGVLAAQLAALAA